MASLLIDNNNNNTTTTTTTNMNQSNNNVNTINNLIDNSNDHLSITNILSDFEELPGDLQICISRYFDDDILAMINVFAKTSTKFLEYEPLRQKYFKVVLAKKYGFDFEKETIYLFGKNITNEDLRYICELLKANNKVETLDLDNNNITDIQNIGELLKANNTLTTFKESKKNVKE